MNRKAPPGLATWLFSLVLRQRDKEMLLGDLIEEHALLISSQGPRHASRWYRNQMLRSIVPVMWANIRRGWWLKTLGSAFVGYLVVVLLVMTGDIVMSKLLPVDEQIYSLVSLAAGFLAMALGGYLAAWMRPGAPVALAVISAVMGVVSMAFTGDRAPMWYQIALIVIGPAAALTGGRIRIRRKEGSRL